MPRPFCPRQVASSPEVVFFKPAGIPLHKLKVEILALDEYEAIRLADGEGLEHAEAATRMNVSRQTFTRIVRAARKKMATFLSKGHALRIEGGPVAEPTGRQKKNSRARADGFSGKTKKGLAA